MDNVIPSRFVLFTYLAAAAMLAIVVDHVARAVAGRRPRPPGRTVLAWCAGLAVVAVALVPIVAYFADGLPLTAVAVQPPEWFTTVAPELPPGQVLLVLPFAFRQSNMTWQAVNGMRYAMVGGGGPNSLPSRAGKEEAGDRYLAQLSFTNGTQDLVAGEVAAVRHALDGWGVTGIVLPDPGGLPDYEQMHAVRSTVVLLTAATGQAPEYRAHAWVWTGVDRAPAALEPPVAQLAACAAGSAGRLAGVDPGLGGLRPRRAAGRLTRTVGRGPVSCGVRRNGPSRGELHAVSGEQRRNRDRPDAAGTRP